MMSMEMMIRIGLATPALKLGMERDASSMGSSLTRITCRKPFYWSRTGAPNKQYM